MLSGSMTLWVGDAPPVRLVPGEYALAPHGVPHTYSAGAEGAVALVTSLPGGFVAFVREAGEPALRPELPVLDGPPDVERLAPHRRRPRHHAARPARHAAGELAAASPRGV